MPQPNDEFEEEREDNTRPYTEGEERLRPENDVIVDYRGSGEEDIKRQEMANKFFTLSTEIGKADEKIKDLLRNRVSIKQKKYALMDGKQEEDFLKAMEKINRNLGAAQALLDAYIELEKSTPEFKNFYNKFYYLYESITKHRRSTFYNFNSERGNYLYPVIDIETKFGGLSFLFSRLCGVLDVCGEYIKDVIYLTPRSQPGYDQGGYGGGYGGAYYPHSYPPSMRPDYYTQQDERIGNGRQKPESRDIGDKLDQG